MINKNNPVHIKSHQLIWLAKQKNKNLYLSPKADGTYKQINIINKLIFEAEYIEKLNLYLVFDIKNYPSVQNNTYLNRLNYLNALHKMKQATIEKVSSLNQIKKLIEIHNNNLVEYLGSNVNGIKWYPKQVFINNLKGEDLLDLLDDENIKFNYDTDGWILTLDNFKNIFKYKPKNHLTIDLYFKNNMFFTSDNTIVNCDFENDDNKQNNSIYRCYWLNNKWKAKDLRFDKLYPNPSYLVDELENLHQNYWTANSLKKYFNENLYYTFDENIFIEDLVIKKILDNKKNIINRITNIITFEDKNIIDIGCGKGIFLDSIKNHYSYLGIDIDPCCITLAEFKYKSKKNTFIWQNFVNLELGCDYNIFLLINTIHFFINDLDSFFQKINKLLLPQCQIIILFIDYDKILEDFNYNDELIIKKINNELFFFKYPWINKSFEEKIISGNVILQYIKKYVPNYQIKFLDIPINNDDNNVIKFWNMHSLLIIEKI